MKLSFKRNFKHYAKRLPYIAIYSILTYCFIVVAQQSFYRFMPSQYFLHYYSATANSIEEHNPVPFRVCRTKRMGNYIVEGQRIFYKVNENGNKQNAEQVASVPIRGAATAKDCADLFVPVSQYDHSQGYYYFRTVLEFKAGGYSKHAEFETNVYAVTAHKVESVEEIEAKIQQLQLEIDKLKIQLEQAKQASQAEQQSMKLFVESNPTPEQEMAVSQPPASTSTQSSSPPTQSPPAQPTNPVEQVLQPVIENLHQLGF